MKFSRVTYILGSVVVALTLAGGGTAFAANRSSAPNSLTRAQWQEEINNVSQPGRGCFHATYPSLKWQATRCLVAPKDPLVPQVSRGGPQTVGNGDDYSAEVSGKISKATGKFTNVSSKLKEKGQIDDTGSQIKNAFSLQLNTEFFSGSAACNGAAEPSECLAWQQFVYAYGVGNGGQNLIFMQYWLLYYDTTCPAGWYTYNASPYTFCYTNSNAVVFGSLPAKDLGDTALVGKAKSGHNDSVSLTNSATGDAASVSNSDSEVDLAASWNTAEWGVFGDAGGGEANFGANSTLEAVTVIKATSSSAPTCEADDGFTGETNNLNFTNTPALGSVSSPTMGVEQTDGTVSSGTDCQVAS